MPEGSDTVPWQGWGSPFKRLRADDSYRAVTSVEATIMDVMGGRLWEGFLSLCRLHYGSLALVGCWQS
jgi:hypothetical protein